MVANLSYSRNLKGTAMRPLNISYLQNITKEDLFSDCENALSGRPERERIRRADQVALRSLIKTLFRAGLDETACYDGFFFSFVLERIGKEFDLVKVRRDRSAVLNIELKSQVIAEEKVEKQLLQNRYYLHMIAGEVCSFTYISSVKRFYTISPETDALTPSSAEELIGAMRRFSDFYETDIAPLFKISEFLISPITTPEPFIRSRYFLTNQQQQFGKELLLLADKTEAGCRFAGITGSPGTGKTLLLYDLARRLSEKRRVLVLHCARLSEGHEILRSAMKDFTIESIRTVTPEYLLQTKPEVILVDEAQRIYLETFELLVTFAGERGLFVVFCHDPAQILTVSERKRDISSRIAALAGENLFILSSRLRTNMEIAAFVTAFFDLRKKTPKYSFSNIRILWAPDADEALRLRRYMESQGYIYIACSEGEGQSAHTLDTHDVIGLEFDRVVVTLGKEFYYDKTGCLRAHAHGNPNYLYDRMLFQNISRTRENLCIIIAENASLFRKAASLTAPGPDRSSGVPSL